MAGKFITFEGGDGSGKSTQVKRFAEYLRSKGHDVVVTREPGGTPEAENIRPLLANVDGGNWSPQSEAFLLFAARQNHVENLIKPALVAGKIVISDRFADSSRAYQGFAGGLGLEWVNTLKELAIGDFEPDLTFLLDVPADVGLARCGKRVAETQSGENRFENKGLAYFEKLRQGYLEVAKMYPARFVVIDALQNMDDITRQIIEKAGI